MCGAPGIIPHISSRTSFKIMMIFPPQILALHGNDNFPISRKNVQIWLYSFSQDNFSCILFWKVQKLTDFSPNVEDLTPWIFARYLQQILAINENVKRFTYFQEKVLTNEHWTIFLFALDLKDFSSCASCVYALVPFLNCQNQKYNLSKFKKMGRVWLTVMKLNYTKQYFNAFNVAI